MTDLVIVSRAGLVHATSCPSVARYKIRHPVTPLQVKVFKLPICGQCLRRAT